MDTTMSDKTLPPILSANDREHFLQRGYVVVRDAIPAARVLEWQELAWQRLGYDRDDPSTWKKARVHLPPSRVVRVEEFAPTAFGAACEIVGGRERICEPYFYGDVFVCNLAEGADRAWQPPSAQSPGWHKDGYFFRHFLDSPEQGLLVIAAWTDVLHQGGGTFIAPDSVGVIARYLAAHPTGVEPEVFGPLIAECREFEEITARAGDVVLLHPFMLHAVSQNALRAPRFISNPILMLKEPMNFQRADGEYSLAERAVLRALGKEHYDFRATGERRSATPPWILDARRDLRQRAECRIGTETKQNTHE
jgi:hypothetical protein